MARKILAVLISGSVLLGLTGSAKAFPESERLQFFSQGTGHTSWQFGKRIDDSPLDTNTFRLRLSVPEQADGDNTGVYAVNTGLGGKFVWAVRNLSFDFLSVAAGGYASAGAPRFSIPIDENADNTPEGYASLAAGQCSESISATWDRADFTGRVAPGCTMRYKGVAYSSDGTNSAWANFAIAHPTFAISGSFFATAVVIQDKVGASFIDRVAFQNRMYVKAGHGPNAIVNCPDEASC
jgi:hypothetical protein